MKLWLVFYLRGKELCRYTVSGTFAGEMQETRCLLAYENGVSLDEITVKTVAGK